MHASIRHCSFQIFSHIHPTSFDAGLNMSFAVSKIRRDICRVVYKLLSSFTPFQMFTGPLFKILIVVHASIQHCSFQIFLHIHPTSFVAGLNMSSAVSKIRRDIRRVVYKLLSSFTPFQMFTSPLFKIKLQLISTVSLLSGFRSSPWIWNPLNQVEPGKFPKYGGHNKHNCLQDWAYAGF